MKGYIHTLEIILSAIIVLVALSQFSSLYTKETPWTRNYLSLLSRDIVYTANFLGVDWQNSSFVVTSIKKILFSDSIEYEFGLKNAIKRNTVIGCFCSSTELERLKNQLGGFNLNEARINFQILDITSAQDWNSLDVIVYAHYQNMDADKQKILDFLKNDKGLVLLSPVTQAQITSDSVLRDIFGLKWITNSVQGSSANSNFTSTHPQNRSYYIKKYFHGFRANSSSNILFSEAGLQGPISCTNSTHEGSFKTRGTGKKIWIIDASQKPPDGTHCDYVVYVDENSNNKVDSGEGPYIQGDNFVLNGYSMKLKEISTQIYNEMVETETGLGWSLASANGLCTGQDDDLCSEGEAVWT
ncbi:MAG: hypothetical protein HY515_04745, partial [Candidatus Aenigmarchaeota archaeon]|nr:hypothetical protein [Candidatus Aenigmarchaeota archaeon]